MRIESKYFIIKTLEKTVPTEEEVKEKAETGYKDKIQTEYAEARIGEMVKAQKVEKVKSVWDTLEKFHWKSKKRERMSCENKASFFVQRT